jgi:MHS family proline/betaine transporter-like MFS transporter
VTAAVDTPGTLNSPAVKRQYAGGRAILAASVGNALEWYDFSVYAFLAIYISGSVFPDNGDASALIKAFLV